MASLQAVTGRPWPEWRLPRSGQLHSLFGDGGAPQNEGGKPDMSLQYERTRKGRLSKTE